MSLTLRFPSLVVALKHWAAATPTSPFLTFVGTDTPPKRWSFAETLAAAETAAFSLAQRGVGPGDRVVVVASNDPATVATTLGAMGLGAIPALVHPPLRADPSAAQAVLRQILTCAQPRLLVGPPELLASFVDVARAPLGEMLSAPQRRELRSPEPDATVYLQFSSGSTGVQKAVQVGAWAQAANATAIGLAIGLGANESWLVWLPIYHDMGLMSGVVLPLYHGVPSVLLSPECFLERPLAWLSAISDYRAALTVAPNFAYALATRRATPERMAGLDLSCLRLAFNGAEPVLPDTIDQFESTFGAVGLRPHTIYPVYGLAENTLAAAFWHCGQPYRVDVVTRAGLARHVAEPAGAGERRSVRLVSVGSALHGHELRVVAPEGQELGERQVGEVEVRGPSQMLGYWGDAAQSAVAYHDGWLRTGDLGYLGEGDLFICGRQKDIVIRFGENFFPADLEQLAASAPGTHPGRVAVIGLADATWATERVWLLVEAEAQGKAAETLAASVRAHVLAASGFKFDGVTVVPRGFIEKTSSGKTRRLACREKLLTWHRMNAPLPNVGRWPS